MFGLRRRPIKDARLIRSMDDLEHAARYQDFQLKGRYGNWLLSLLVTQLLATNVFMYLYASLGQRPAWAVPDGVMQAWLGSTVVQLVGVVYVVVSHLFPAPPKAKD